MNRAILEACAPWCAALAGLCGLFVVIARLSGGRWQIERLRSLHRCEAGGVQSLAFVLTLPVLVWVLQFIVQVGLVMNGLMIVNYAAFASARAASVWTPATVLHNASAGWDAADWDADDQNELPEGIAPGVPMPLTADNVTGSGSRKYEKIFSAAALACASIAPSRDSQDAAYGARWASNAAYVTRSLYGNFDVGSRSKLRMSDRLDAKLGYSFANTYVALQFEDRNSAPIDGTMTYNPINDDLPYIDQRIPYYPSEVGWQDPITVTVFHDFALLPGMPAWWFSSFNASAATKKAVLFSGLRRPDDVSKVTIEASATMTNEGIRSVRPYVHPDYPE